MKRKVRIIKRTGPEGRPRYIIQQRHFMFRWWWVDAWVNSWEGAWCTDDFDTLEEAQHHLCYFDGTKCTERVMPLAKREGSAR